MPLSPDTLTTPISPLILIGDLNCRMSCWLQSDPDTTEGRKLIATLDDLGLLQLVTHTPTRYAPTGRSPPSLLDLVITNTPHLVTTPEVLPPLSDHCPVLCNIQLRQLRQQTREQIAVQDYARTDFEAMRADLWLQPLRECIDGASCMESAWHSWHSYANENIQGHLAMRTLKPRRKQTTKPWFTAQHKRMHRNKTRIFKLAQRTKALEDWIAYKMVRNALTNSLKRSKSLYFEELCSRIDRDKNCYKWWAEAKKIAQISKKRATIPTLVDDCGDAACDSSKAEALARCFKSQFSPNPSFDPCATTLPPAQFTPDLQFQLPNITLHVVFRKLRTLPKHKSVGGDITNIILREVAPVITQSLCHLFNTSLRLGQLPSDWKLATVIPIYKENGKPAEPASYRPISLLPAIAKILDVIIAEHLTSFLNRQGLITDHQYGFVSCMQVDTRSANCSVFKSG